MPDQYGVVTRLLESVPEFAGWHVVEPVPGGLRGDVWIQNEKAHLDAYVAISPADSDTLSRDEMISRIRRAIANATDSRYRGS